jgi:hypothetical protein
LGGDWGLFFSRVDEIAIQAAAIFKIGFAATLDADIATRVQCDMRYHREGNCGKKTTSFRIPFQVACVDTTRASMGGLSKLSYAYHPGGNIFSSLSSLRLGVGEQPVSLMASAW